MKKIITKKKIFTLLKRLEPIFKVIVLIIPIIIIIQIATNILQASSYKYHKTIDFNPLNFKNSQCSLYVDESPTLGKLSTILDDDGYYYSKINYSPISFVADLEHPIYKQNIIIHSLIDDDGNWDIGWPCSDCKEKNSYNWETFYYGKLKNYHLLESDNKTYIYQRKNNSETENHTPTKSKDICHWAIKNIDQLATVKNINNACPRSYFINHNIQFIENSNTIIENKIRGKSEFYLYLKDKMDLTVEKKEIDLEQEPNNVSIILTDIEGKIISDNHIKNNTENKQRFTSKIPKEGLYKLSFTSDNKSNMNWFIDYLRVNTNKIILSEDKTYLMGQNEIYINTPLKKTIEAYSWHYRDNLVLVSDKNGNNQITEINKSDINSWSKINIWPGKIKIETSDGMYIRGAYFSFNPENFFSPFVFDIEHSIDEPDYIITDFLFTPQKKWNSVSKSYTLEEINPTQSDRLHFLLKNTELNNNHYQKNDLRKFNFSLLVDNGIQIWGKNDETIKDTKLNNNDVYDILENVLPKNTTIYSHLKQVINPMAVVGIHPWHEKYLRNPQINIKLRGDHSFFINPKEKDLTININITETNIYKGPDPLTITLTNMLDEEICKKQISDDNNSTNNRVSTTKTVTFQCNNLDSNKPYILRINQNQRSNGYIDFIIDNISTNAKDILIRNRFYSTQPATIYTKIKSPSNITFNYWNRIGEQQITIQNIYSNQTETITLTSDDLNKPKQKLLSAGIYKIDIPKGHLYLSGTNFSTNPQSGFDILPKFKFANTLSNAVDFVLDEDRYPILPKIKELSVEIK